jgi:hypothetical protein
MINRQLGKYILTKAHVTKVHTRAFSWVETCVQIGHVRIQMWTRQVTLHIPVQIECK